VHLAIDLICLIGGFVYLALLFLRARGFRETPK